MFFTNENPEFKRWLTQRKFSGWIEAYGKYKNYNIDSGRTNGDRWINFTKKVSKEELNF